MATNNPKAGAATQPGAANTIPTSPMLEQPNPFRPRDGQIIDLAGGLRVQGSAPGIDPRDPQNSNPNKG